MQTPLPLYDDRHDIVQLPPVVRICLWLLGALRTSQAGRKQLAVVVAAPGLLTPADFEESLALSGIRVSYALESPAPADALILIDADDALDEIAARLANEPAKGCWIIVVAGRDCSPPLWLANHPVFDLMADDAEARGHLADLLWRHARRDAGYPADLQADRLASEVRQAACGFALPEIRRIVAAVSVEHTAGRTVPDDWALWRLPALRDLHPGAQRLPCDGQRIAAIAGELVARWAARNTLSCIPNGAGRWLLELPSPVGVEVAAVTVTLQWARNAVVLSADTPLHIPTAEAQARVADWINAENARFDHVALALVVGSHWPRLSISGEIFVPAATTRAALILAVEMHIERVETVVHDAWIAALAGDGEATRG